MVVQRIVKLADGEELISFESVERVRTVVDDPRKVLLAHRRSADAGGDPATISAQLVNRRLQ